MTNESKLVQDYYTQGELLELIYEFVKGAGVDPEHLDYKDLFACDQLHARGIDATREHIKYARISSGMHVLDVGCGIGGSSRCIAVECDCNVTGIDLTQEFVDVARELTAHCGLGYRIEFFQANALDMAFEDATFDHVWCHAVTMNIEDKTGLVAEIGRVLKSNGRFSCSENARGPGGEPFYPLPWASDPSSNFLVTPEEMRRLLEDGGFRVVEQINLNEASLAFQREVSERASRDEPPLIVNPLSLKLGKNFLERVQNAGKSFEGGRLVEHLIIAEKA